MSLPSGRIGCDRSIGRPPAHRPRSDDYRGGENLAGGAGLPKPKALGYSHELWTTRLLAAHARDRGPAAGHPSVAKLAQGTVCKILAITRSSRTRCAITWRSAIRNSSQDGGNPVHLSPSRGVARAGTSRS